MPDEQLLKSAAKRLDDDHVLELLKRILAAARTPEAREFLEPALFGLACSGLDEVLSNARAIGRKGSYFPVEALRVRRTIVLLCRADKQYEWVIPACQRRVADELFKAGLGTEAETSVDCDMARVHHLRVFGVSLRGRVSRQSGVRVELLDVETGRPAPSCLSPARGPLAAGPPAALARPLATGGKRSPAAVPRGRRWRNWPGRRVQLGLASALAAGCAVLAWLTIFGSDNTGPYALFSFDSFDGARGEMQYAMYVPPDYRSRKSLPLVVFLHGLGERGDDGRLPLGAGLGPAVVARSAAQKPLDFLVFFPQSYSGRWDPGSEDGLLLMQALAWIEKRYNVDPSRIYLTGVSDGGAGVWQLAARYPDKWAAIVPVGGNADPAAAPAVQHIPCWCFHGGEDPVVLPAVPRAMIAELRKAGGSPKYTEYPGRGRDCGIKAYSTLDLWPWLMDQRLSRRAS